MSERRKQLTPRDYQPRTAPAIMHVRNTTDIVAFVYNVEFWHPPCVLKGLGLMDNPENKGVLPGTVCSMIKQHGRFMGLARDDPRWEDSETLPQPLTTDEMEPGQQCYGCGEEIEL